MRGGFSVLGAGSPLSTSSWLSLAALAHVNQLLSPPLKLHIWSEGVEHWREWEALGWEGAWIPPTPSPPPTPNIHGRFSSAGTQLERPPSTTRTLMGLMPPTSSSLGGNKSPRQPSRELSLGSPLASLPLCPRKEVTASPHSLEGAQRLQWGPDFTWLDSGARAQPSLPLAVGKLPWCGDVGARAARGQHHRCQTEG